MMQSVLSSMVESRVRVRVDFIIYKKSHSGSYRLLGCGVAPLYNLKDRTFNADCKRLWQIHSSPKKSLRKVCPPLEMSPTASQGCYKLYSHSLSWCMREKNGHSRELLVKNLSPKRKHALLGGSHNEAIMRHL